MTGAGRAQVAAELSEEDGVPIVRLRGELDISTVTTVRPMVEQLVRRAPARVVVDMAALGFMDSSGIALLLTLAGAVERLELRQPSEIVRRVVEVTGLAGTLVIVP